jgi:peptidoglycan/LPS O-acetylase OafA/YrhL
MTTRRDGARIVAGGRQRTVGRHQRVLTRQVPGALRAEAVNTPTPEKAQQAYPKHVSPASGNRHAGTDTRAPVALSRNAIGFRPEIEGLRGVAIFLVVVGHAGIAGFDAGFIGVDVFFVLSGFLITGLLADEHERTGRIELGTFYARRAKRILPAAAVVVVATLVGAFVVFSPLDMAKVAQDGLAAGLSVANIRFALGATDYFSAGDPSPMLHYWSLSVEEQFYLVWPALLIVAMRGGRPQFTLVFVAGTVLIGSLLLCVVVTAMDGSWAYFSLPTRAWQLAAGGVLAIAVRGSARLPTPVSVTIGWAGAVLLVGSIALITPATPYPDIAATAPTAGTLALIAAGNAPGTPGALLLARAPLRWLGRISYSLYLWHWPVLVLGAALLAAIDAPIALATGSPLQPIVLIAVSVVLAALTWRLIEEPFRAGRLSHGGRRRAIALATAAILSVTVTSTALSGVAQAEVVGVGSSATTGGADDPENVSEVDEVWASEAQIVDPSTTPADPSGSPRPTPSTSATATPRATPKPPTQPKAVLKGPLPEGLRPTLGDARDDSDRLVRDGCGLAIGGSEPPDCVYGDKAGGVTVALVGDSHAMNWFPAFERVAIRRHWRLVPFTKYSCVFVDMRIWSDYLKREYTECETWRERVVGRLRRLKPDLVVISSNKWFQTIVDRDGEPKRQGAALAALIERIPGRVAILVDTPRSDHDVPACLARHPREIQRCTTRKAVAFGWRHRIRELEARRLSGAPVIDLSARICPTDPCPPIIGRRVVYRDHHHLTATFAATLAPDLDGAIREVLAP